MTCPDTERLLEVVLGEGVDPRVQHHLRACPDCAATARLIRDMRAAYRPELHIPDELVQARVELVTQELRVWRSRRAEPTPWDAAAAGALSFVTVLLAIVFTSSAGDSTVWGPAVLCVTASIAAAVYERRLGVPGKYHGSSSTLAVGHPGAEASE